MDKNLAQEAILAALSGKWQLALSLNKEILKSEPNDIEALNRLARAYSEIGNIKKAKVTAQKALKIDPFNPIASKALEKWKGLKKSEVYAQKPSDPQIFLEEPGRTKILNLLHLGSPKIMAKLDAGDEVKLNSHPHKVSVNTFDGKYIGKLPDDLSARIRKLISLGNEYQVFIKSIDKNGVKVFIREVKRSSNLNDIPSFSSEKIEYVSFTPPELVHRKEEFEVEAEEDEE